MSPRMHLIDPHILKANCREIFHPSSSCPVSEPLQGHEIKRVLFAPLLSPADGLGSLLEYPPLLLSQFTQSGGLCADSRVSVAGPKAGKLASISPD